LVQLGQQPWLAVLLSGQVPFGVFIAEKTIVLRVEMQRPSRTPSRVTEMAKQAGVLADRFKVGGRPLSSLHAGEEILYVGGRVPVGSLFVAQ